MRNAFIFLAILALAACSNGKKHKSQSASAAGAEWLIQLESNASEYAIQLDGGDEVWMENTSGNVFSLTVEDVADGAHTIECIDEEADRQEMCRNVTVNGFRQCTYLGDLRYRLRVVSPVVEDDEDCDLIVYPTDPTNPPPQPPNPPPPPPPSPTPVPFTDVTVTVCSYDTYYGYPLTARCSFYGSWTSQVMTFVSGSACQSTTFTNVPTGRDDYACNFYDPVNDRYLFDPNAVTQPNNVYFANGVQLGGTVANDLRVALDAYAQVGLYGRTYTFTIYPTTTLQGPVYLQVGHGSQMNAYLMSPIGGGWQVTVTLAYGLDEVNVTAPGMYVFLDPNRPGFEDGAFYVHDGATTTLPGRRILASESIMYATVPTQQTYPSYVVVTQMRYLIDLSSTGIQGRTQDEVFFFSYTWPGP